MFLVFMALESIKAACTIDFMKAKRRIIRGRMRIEHLRGAVGVVNDSIQDSNSSVETGQLCGSFSLALR
jgi:hypothetical protein